ncbi:MAG: UxaA family hydrolase [Beijerinckiaceae bacterium]
MSADAIRLHADDTVAVALRDLPAGASIRWQGGAKTGEVAAREAIPLGHKISLAAVPAGAAVMKYGAPIGRATRAIAAGAHVHVHNLESARARRRP